MNDDEYPAISSPEEIKFLLKRLTAKTPKSSTQLMNAAIRYFESAADTTLPNAHGKPTPRPWTLDGFLLSANITRSEWSGFSNNTSYKRTCERIQMIIRTQKFELAATGAFVSAVLIRDLDLIDKTDMTSAGSALPTSFVRKIVDT